ncbi:MAG: hypothetical protein IT233_09415 [Bacteroidia bacterium]|nr:hypothetical protein [Bacteroidia bacterium]
MEFIDRALYYFLSFLIRETERFVSYLKKAEQSCSFRELNDQRRMIILMRQEFKNIKEQETVRKSEEFKATLFKTTELKIARIVSASRRNNSRIKELYEKNLDLKEWEKKLNFILTDSYLEKKYRNRELSLFKNYIEKGYWKYEGSKEDTRKRKK